MQPRVFIAGLALAALTLIAPGAACAAEPPEATHPARQAAQRAVEKGDLEAATRHLLRALEDHPHSLLLLADLVRASSETPGLRGYWVHQWAAALADKKGQVRVPKESADLIAKDDPHPRGLAAARARATAEVVRQAGLARGPGALLLARSWARIFRILVESSPALSEGYGPELYAALASLEPTTEAALKVLEAAVSTRPPAALEPWRVRLGLALLGLASQARQKLAGSPEGAAERLLTLGARLQREIKAAIAAGPREPLSVATLRAMKPAEVTEWNRLHTDPALPGVALSPSGRYKVVTACGHETLLATAEEADRVHARLAAWLGSDPFEKQRGQIVVVPESADLESHGAPYWWAGGFQRGLVTTVQFSLGSRRDLRGSLAHELTHRFDARLTPSMPPWLMEGRAVWTALALRTLSHEEPEDHVADLRGIGEAPGHIYGHPEGLGLMLAGKTEDYRHHYTAGHALWVYLRSAPAPDGTPLFRERLSAHLEALKAPTADAAALFRAHFVDGLEGRPATLAGFADGFREFMRLFRAYPVPEELKRFYPRWNEEREAVILDRPTISRARAREEPVFGQDHIGRAAHAVAALGDARGAILLFEWALAHDELDTAATERLVALLMAGESKPARAAAWLEARRRISTIPSDAGGRGAGGASEADVLAPFAVRPLLDMLDALAAASKDYGTRGLADLALWFADEHDRLGAMVGRPPLAPLGATGGQDRRSVPVFGPPLALGARGWKPGALAGFDKDWIRPDLWHVTTEGQLVVGSPARATLAAEYEEPFTQTFVHSTEAPESGYVLRARLHLLTPYVSAHVVVGFQRPDRCVRLSVEAGERPHPSQGPMPMRKHTSAYVRLLGVRPFDSWHSWKEQGDQFLLSNEDSSFALRLLVDGPRVEAWIDDRLVGSWVDAEGLPVDGSVGFGVDGGIVRVGGAVIERLRGRSAEGGELHGEHDLAAPRAPLSPAILGRRLRGVPSSPSGTIVLWLPFDFDGGTAPDPAQVLKLASYEWEDVARTLDDAQHGARLAVVVPRAWPEACRSALRQAVEAQLGARGLYLEHGEWGATSGSPAPPSWGGEARWLFVDPVGIARRYLGRGWTTLPDDWLDWFNLTLGHGAR